MTEERRQILDKINNLLDKRKAELFEEFPNVHEIDDGVIIRFFTEWDNCAESEEIKFKKLDSDNPDESVVFFFLPKGSSFKLQQRFFIGCMTCLSGKMNVHVRGETIPLESYRKICINSEEVGGDVLENTYLITTSDKRVWSEASHKHMEVYN